LTLSAAAITPAALEDAAGIVTVLAVGAE